MSSIVKVIMSDVITKVWQIRMDEIIFYLRKKYHPKAILLHGSRARGDDFDHSDYDLALITDNHNKVRPEHYHGQALDISGFSPTELVLKAGQTPIWPCSVLFDDADGLGHRLAAQTQNAFMQGPLPLTREDLENRCNFSKRLIQRILGRGDNPMMRFYYLGDFYQRSLRYWCEFRQKWTLSVHLLLPLIAAEDPVFYQELQDLWTKNYRKAAFKIHQHLFEQDQ